MLLGLGEMVEVVRVFAKIDKAAIARGIGWVRPGNDEHRVVRRTFGGPVREH
jgi:ribosomal protein S28E/S33